MNKLIANKLVETTKNIRESLSKYLIKQKSLIEEVELFLNNSFLNNVNTQILVVREISCQDKKFKKAVLDCLKSLKFSKESCEINEKAMGEINSHVFVQTDFLANIAETLNQCNNFTKLYVILENLLANMEDITGYIKNQINYISEDLLQYKDVESYTDIISNFFNYALIDDLENNLTFGELINYLDLEM